MVRSGTRWRFSEVEAAAVVLSSSHCAARVLKPTPDGGGGVFQSINVHAVDGVSCRIDVS